MVRSSIRRVAEARERVPEAALRAAALGTAVPPRLKLEREGFDLIAELKLRSPSMGDLSASTIDPMQRLEAYAEGGAAICSILTEPDRFGGELDHLRLAAEVLQPYGVPAMRKDFLVDPYQVLEARAYGASGVLLIVRMVPRERLVAMMDCAAELGLFVLLEAFSAGDLHAANEVARGREGRDEQVLMDVNCRDLETLEICASMLILKELKSRSYIDFVWGALNQTDTPDQFSALLEKKGFQKTYNVQPQHTVPFTKELPIIFGCDSFCTYCIVPYLRGREKSLPEDYLLSELEKAASAGYKEVLLLGQNVNHYGSDLDPSLTFAGLMGIMAEKHPAIRFDFLTSHPKDFDIQILQVMQNNPNIYRHFHLPAQHGDNEILQRMNRGYTRETYLALITTIRSFFPMVTLSTDLIVGFPGESEQAFEHTLDLIKTVQFDMIFAAQYSKRPGTPAEEFPDQVPETIKRERINALLETQKQISRINNRRWIGQRCKLIITGKGQDHQFFGKTEEEKTVSIFSDSLQIGMELNALITKIDNGSLIAEALEE